MKEEDNKAEEEEEEEEGRHTCRSSAAASAAFSRSRASRRASSATSARFFLDATRLAFARASACAHRRSCTFCRSSVRISGARVSLRWKRSPSPPHNTGFDGGKG